MILPQISTANSSTNVYTISYRVLPDYFLEIWGVSSVSFWISPGISPKMPPRGFLWFTPGVASEIIQYFSKKSFQRLPEFLLKFPFRYFSESFYKVYRMLSQEVFREKILIYPCKNWLERNSKKNTQRNPGNTFDYWEILEVIPKNFQEDHSKKCREQLHGNAWENLWKKSQENSIRNIISNFYGKAKLFKIKLKSGLYIHCSAIMFVWQEAISLDQILQELCEKLIAESVWI